MSTLASRVTVDLVVQCGSSPAASRPPAPLLPQSIKINVASTASISSVYAILQSEELMQNISISDCLSSSVVPASLSSSCSLISVVQHLYSLVAVDDALKTQILE